MELKHCATYIQLDGVKHTVSKEVHEYISKLVDKLDELIEYTQNDHRPVCKNRKPQDWDNPTLEHCTCWVKEEMQQLYRLRNPI